MRILLENKALIATTGLAIVVLYGLATWGPPLGRSVPSPSLPAAVAVPVEQQAFATEQPPAIFEPPHFLYMEVTDGCGPYYEGECVHMRSGPGTEYPIVGRLRTGVVLKVSETVLREGYEWHKIQFDEGVRYPERVEGDWYVAAEFVSLFDDEGESVFEAGVSAMSAKRIVVDRSEQMLYAYDGDSLFMQEPISTGLEFTPTPRGTFIVYKKTPSRYMQGPIPEVSDQYFDLPGVPWDLYFTYGGAVIHGAYWHDRFGEPWSHGCVNLPPQKAKELYLWADVGTPVTVQD